VSTRSLARSRSLVPETLDDARLGVAALGVGLLAAGLLLLYAGRHLTFFYDEWNFILERRGGGLGTYLDPHNGHLSLFPVLVYKALFATVGLRSYLPYRLVQILLHLGCGTLLYIIARRRLGPLWALVPTALLLVLGSAWEDLLWPFQIGYFGSVLGGLGALTLLDGASRHRGWAAACLTLAIISSGVGIPFVVAAAALMAVQRAPLRAYWVIAVPLLVYLAWYAGWGSGDQTTANAILGAPQYIADAGAGAAAGLAGLTNDPGWGPALAVALVIAVISGWPRRAGSPAMLVAGCVGALVFWILTAVVRSGPAEPAASRYLYVGAVFILLILVDARVGASVRGPWLAVGALLLLGALVANIGDLRSGVRGLRAPDDSVRASLAAVQIAAPVVPAAFQPDSANGPQITAGPYLAAEHALGSPAPSPGALGGEPESFRTRVDAVLAAAETTGPPRALPPAALAVEAVYGARTTRRGACVVVVPTSAPASLDLALPVARSLRVAAPASGSAAVYVRRFASTFTMPAFATVPAGATPSFGFPRDLVPTLTWHIQVVASSRFSVCGGR
jgi:hypothetical protein